MLLCSISIEHVKVYKYTVTLPHSTSAIQILFHFLWTSLISMWAVKYICQTNYSLLSSFWHCFSATSGELSLNENLEKNSAEFRIIKGYILSHLHKDFFSLVFYVCFRGKETRRIRWVLQRKEIWVVATNKLNVIAAGYGGANQQCFMFKIASGCENSPIKFSYIY